MATSAPVPQSNPPDPQVPAAPQSEFLSTAGGAAFGIRRAAPPVPAPTPPSPPAPAPAVTPPAPFSPLAPAPPIVPIAFPESPTTPQPEIPTGPIEAVIILPPSTADEPRPPVPSAQTPIRQQPATVAAPLPAPVQQPVVQPTSPGVVQQNTRNNARDQAQLSATCGQTANSDWRVRLRLAPSSNYLYNSPYPGILQPLRTTDGVVFPYTPAVTTTYTALYNNFELTHSNYRGYFYQGSQVGEVNIQASFTCQDAFEAAYLLAVIQFFRSVTKMFYGQQDAFRGSPPPLVFLEGYGDYQFNRNPCVVSQFDYSLPADVDYIRAAINPNGTNIPQNVGSTDASMGRMAANGLSPGGTRPLPPPTTLGGLKSTYVPTKMDIKIMLLPMQTRSQISRQFSMEKYANGSLVRGGFW